MGKIDDDVSSVANDPISDFPKGIGQPATRALAAAGYYRLEQLTQVSEADLLKLHGMGPKALGILRETLAAQGLAFAPGIPITRAKKQKGMTDDQAI